MENMDSMKILQNIFKHSDTSTTTDYFGISKAAANRYYADFAEAWKEFISGRKEENHN